MSENYHEDIKIKNILRLRSKLEELPPFMEEYFRGIAETTAPRTRIGYAYDFKIFFTYLYEHSSKLKNKKITELDINDLASITAEDIERFMEYLSFYTKNENGEEIDIQNEERGKSRKLAAIRTLFAYFFKKQKIGSNPADLVDFPKLHEKTITRLEVHEVAKLLDEVESGAKLSPRQQKFHELTKKRDLAIITLLLGTGIRVTECVGINIEHIDFEINGIKITRKGGNEVIIYFGDEVFEALEDYLYQRLQTQAIEGHQNAFFLSLQNRRITDRTIQNLVKKYSKLVTTLKNISPHKLRSTYGTNLYQETGDIYLVADVLGHADVNTTRKHYAHMEEERRRQAAKYVKLRR